MKFASIIGPLAVILFTIGAWRQFGWPGLVLAAGGVLMWVLLHFTRLMHILKKASTRPIGHVASSVMLHARLKKGMTLMHVIAMTKSLGTLLSVKDEQPEVFEWRDAGQSSVRCTFAAGKLQEWTLNRPPVLPEPQPIDAQASVGGSGAETPLGADVK